MNLTRALTFALASAATILFVDGACAQAFPGKPVRLIVPYVAGGPNDTVARILAQKLTERWHQQVIVDNRGGSGGAIGALAVVKAPPDGYTLLFANSGPMTVYPNLRKTLAYSREQDFEPVTMLVISCMVMIAHPSLPAKSIPELVRLAKKRPGALTYSSSGVGGVQHLGMVLFESFAGISMVHVPYKGGAPATLDVIGGQIDLQFNNIVGSLPFAKAGKVRAIAVSTATPASALPDVPPVAKFYPKFDVASWMAIYAPANTPKEVLTTLIRDSVWAISNPESKQHIAELGAEVVAGGPAELVAYTRNESELFAKAVAAGNIPKE